jgi:hypothetical protein
LKSWSTKSSSYRMFRFSKCATNMSENECSRQTLHKLRLISRIVGEKRIRRTVKKAASKTFSSVRDFFLLHTIFRRNATGLFLRPDLPFQLCNCSRKT